MSSEGTTESLSPLRGSTHSCLTYSGSASLHHLPVVLLPFGDYAVVNGLSVITAMSDNVGISQMPGSMAVVFGKPEGRGSRMVVETFNLLIAEGHDKNKGLRYMI